MPLLEMHFVSLSKCSAVRESLPPMVLKRKAEGETNPDDFFGPGFEVLWYCGSTKPQRAKPRRA